MRNVLPEYKLHELMEDGRKKQRNLVFDEEDGVISLHQMQSCLRHGLLYCTAC